MDARTIVLGVVLLFVVGMGGLTVEAVIDQGLDLLTGLSILVLALFGFGVVGALLRPPE
jgi:Na+/H+ antiporter NhaC